MPGTEPVKVGRRTYEVVNAIRNARGEGRVGDLRNARGEQVMTNRFTRLPDPIHRTSRHPNLMRVVLYPTFCTKVVFTVRSSDGRLLAGHR